MRVKLNKKGDILPNESITYKELVAQRVRQILALSKGDAFFAPDRGLNHEAIQGGLYTNDQILGTALFEISKIENTYVISSGLNVENRELQLRFGVQINADN